MPDSLVLPSLTVSGFRVFRHLDVARLGRVNLIVGKNNVGKSSVLEALRLYATRAHPAVLFDILESRDELWVSGMGSQHRESAAQGMIAIEYLFHGYPALSAQIDPIRIGSLGLRENTLALSIHWYQEERDDDGIVRRVELPDGTTTETMLPGMRIDSDDTKRVIRLDRESRHFRGRALPTQEDGYACVYVSSHRPDRLNPIGCLWDQIALTDGESDVIAGMQIITPAVQRLSLLGNKESVGRDRTVMVKLDGCPRPLPLHTLGDGICHVFEMVLSLVNAKGGVLLIDEIENGLHYSVQTELWKTILCLAERLNVQVFATSHSWDCIEAFQAACHETQREDGALIRLSEHAGDIVATTFSSGELSIAARDQIEVR